MLLDLRGWRRGYVRLVLFNGIQGHHTTVFTGRRWDVVLPEVVVVDMFGGCGLLGERQAATRPGTHETLEGIFVRSIEGE